MSLEIGLEAGEFRDKRHGEHYVQFCTPIKPEMHTDIAAPLRHLVHMGSYRESAADYLRAVMVATGKTATELAKSVEVSHTTFTRLLKDPNYKYAPKFPTLRKLSDRWGVPLPQGLSGEEGEAETRYLTVMHRVQAGYWAESDAYAQASVDRHAHPVAVDARFAQWPQWLELVVGDSADRKVPEGAFAHVIDAIEMGYAARAGDWVVVERRRSGGHLRERTIKQIEITGREVKLWPRSSNPKWADPVSPHEGCEGEEIEVEIVGLVIGAYSPF